MDEKWRRQLKSKGGFMVMFILGGVFTPFAFIGLIITMAIDYPEVGVPVFFLFLINMACLIVGSIFTGKINRHNHNVEERYKAECNAAKAAEMMQNAVQNSVTQQTSTADEIEKYQQLLLSGAITKGEFEAKKKQLLGL